MYRFGKSRYNILDSMKEKTMAFSIRLKMVEVMKELGL